MRYHVFSANVDWFSKFFYQVIRKKILYHKYFHITCNILLHYFVKVENPKMLMTLTAPQQTVDMFLRLRWGLDLTFNSSKTNCLKTADIDWLTNILKFVRRRLKSTAGPYLVERCCIMVIFFTMIIFAPSSFFLRYISCVVHTFK